MGKTLRQGLWTGGLVWGCLLKIHMSIGHAIGELVKKCSAGMLFEMKINHLPKLFKKKYW